MPRKVQYSREMIIDAAIEMVRAKGYESINARDLGAWLGCSSRPLFTAFKNMEEVVAATRMEAAARFLAFVREAEKEDIFARDTVGTSPVAEPISKRMGMRIVQFAAREPNLYNFIHWSGGTMPDVAELREMMSEYYVRDYQLSPDEARDFFEQMMLFSMGLCTMITNHVREYKPEEIGHLLQVHFQATMAYFKRNQEQGTRNKEPRTRNKEPRTRNQEQGLK
ncbi:MAG: TetR/AcrR family transcriptional regulator [Paludibacteraceae bacterium]